MTDCVVKTRRNGTKMWWRDGKLHRDDGPAIEWAHGTKMWWRDGELIDVYYPLVRAENGGYIAGCRTFRTLNEARVHLDSKERPFARDLYLADIERLNRTERTE